MQASKKLEMRVSEIVYPHYDDLMLYMSVAAFLMMTTVFLIILSL